MLTSLGTDRLTLEEVEAIVAGGEESIAALDPRYPTPWKFLKDYRNPSTVKDAQDKIVCSEGDKIRYREDSLESIRENRARAIVATVNNWVMAVMMETSDTQWLEEFVRTRKRAICYPASGLKPAQQQALTAKLKEAGQSELAEEVIGLLYARKHLEDIREVLDGDVNYDTEEEGVPIYLQGKARPNEQILLDDLNTWFVRFNTAPQDLGIEESEFKSLAVAIREQAATNFRPRAQTGTTQDERDVDHFNSVGQLRLTGNKYRIYSNVLEGYERYKEKYLCADILGNIAKYRVHEDMESLLEVKRFLIMGQLDLATYEGFTPEERSLLAGITVY